jgi:hypothetical protein
MPAQKPVTAKIAAFAVQHVKGTRHFALAVKSTTGQKIVLEFPVSFLLSIASALIDLLNKIQAQSARKHRKPSPTVH